MRYRADIDGLRGIAVVAVLLFHAGFAPFTGGFVGVDVFFVVSGFLITSIILRDVARDEFSLACFYERRARRIIPALTVVLLATTALSWWLAAPEELARYGESLTAAALFGSNLFFWSESGYFQPEAETYSLLHCWSLAIEEQFYLLYPPVLALVARTKRRALTPLVVGVAALSLACSVGLTGAYPTSSFYLPHTRAWELLLGALLALARPTAPRPALAAVTAAAGLALIGVSSVWFTKTTPFPGAYALLPCVGTALVIGAGRTPGNPITRALSTKPLRFVGKISYSLYLWHWPLLLLYREYLLRPLTTAERAGVLLVSFGIATLSWRLVETPLRDRSFLTQRQVLRHAAATLLGLAAAGLTLATVAGSGASSTDPEPITDDDAAVDPELAETETSDSDEDGIGNGNERVAGLKRRWLGVKNPATFAVWGDSHARALRHGLHRVAKEGGHSGVMLGVGGCPPLLGVQRTGVLDCDRATEQAVEHIIARPNITRVFLIARWGLYAESSRYRAEAGAPLWLFDSQSDEESVDANQRVFRRGLERTVARLQAHGRQVTLVGPIPEIGYHVPATLEKIERRGLTLELEPTLAMFQERQASALTLLRDEATRSGLTIVYPHEALCDESRCRVVDDGKPLYRDSNHLHRRGSTLAAAVFAEHLPAPSQ